MGYNSKFINRIGAIKNRKIKALISLAIMMPSLFLLAYAGASVYFILFALIELDYYTIGECIVLGVPAALVGWLGTRIASKIDLKQPIN